MAMFAQVLGTAKVTERPKSVCSITGNGSVCPGYTLDGVPVLLL